MLLFVCSQSWHLLVVPRPHFGGSLWGRDCHHEKGNCNILAPGWASLFGKSSVQWESAEVGFLGLTCFTFNLANLYRRLNKAYLCE